MAKRKTTKDFIKDSKKVHGDVFDYSKVDYQGAKKKVCIICPDHGDFWQIPSNHIRGTGCRKCADEDNSKRLRRPEPFILDICEKHGWYTTTKRLLKDRKFPCEECFHENRSAWCRIGKERFIIRSREIHGNLYGYDEVLYKNNETKVKITCGTHGVFEQRPGSHLRGAGCPWCSYERIAKLQRKDVDWFVDRATEVHGGFYSYEKITAYERNRDMLTITCPKHGDFEQIAGYHLSGRGCRECSRESASERWDPISSYGLKGFYGTCRESNIYVVIINESFVKVGLSVNVKKRIQRLKRDSDQIKSVEIVYERSGVARQLFDLEQKIIHHSKLKRYTTPMKFEGRTECLYLFELDNIIEIIDKTLQEEHKK